MGTVSSITITWFWFCLCFRTLPVSFFLLGEGDEFLTFGSGNALLPTFDGVPARFIGEIGSISQGRIHSINHLIHHLLINSFREYRFHCGRGASGSAICH